MSILLAVVVFVLGLGCVAGGIAFAYEAWGDGIVMTITGEVIALMFILFGIFLCVLAFHINDGPSDPCRHSHIIGKVIYTTYDHGWISYGGRPVWCGPGNPQ